MDKAKVKHKQHKQNNLQGSQMQTLEITCFTKLHNALEFFKDYNLNTKCLVQRCNISKQSHSRITVFQILDAEIKATHYNSTGASLHILSHATQA